MIDQHRTSQPGRSEKASGRPSIPSMRHDALFREAFTDPKRADVLLRWLLPESIVSSFGDELPKSVRPDFVDENLATTQSDVLLQVRLRNGKDVCFLMLLEHKSRNDPDTLLQVARYQIQAWQRILARDRSKQRALPPILPVVFYHGKEPWTVPTSLKEAIDFMGLPEGEFPAGFWYILCNIRDVPLEELPQHPEVLPVLIAFRGAQPELMVPLLGAMGVGSSLGRQLLHYTVRLHGNSVVDARMAMLPEDQRIEMEVEMHPEIEAICREAKIESFVEGEAKGEAKGRADTLLRFLEHRFGPLRPDLRDRVSSASLDQLRQWVDDALDARSPEEALGLPGTA